MKYQKYILYPVMIAVFLLLPFVSFLTTPVGAAQGSDPKAAAQVSGTRIYLPLVVSGVASVETGNNTGALWLPYTFGDGGVLPTYGASLAVDNQGGIHVVYSIYIGNDDQGQKPVTYAHCSARCGEKANWTFTHLGDGVFDARIALDPAGKPRILLFGSTDPSSERMYHQYAACDSGCSDSKNWKITTLVTPIETIATREYNNNRYFAIDKQGRPAFVYTDYDVDVHRGTFYMSCQANCTDVKQWTETYLDYTLFDKPSLAFSPTGQPRLAFGYSDLTDPNLDLILSYAECNENCTNGESWAGNKLVKIHGTTMFNLAVDTNGRPRMGVYSGSYAYDPFQDHTLYYLWCNSGCSVGTSWSFADMGMAFSTGDGVDLALDKLNRPRLSFETSNQGMGYAWCNMNCESENATWQTQEVETQASLAENYEVLPIRKCTVSTWFNGQRSSLALDPAGNPRLAYDAQHWWYGTEIIGGVPKTCNFQDVTVTRVSIINQP